MRVLENDQILMRTLFSLLMICSSMSASAEKVQAPNIILIMCDDLGWGDVGFNGNQIIQTPNLDKMADSGIKFNRFYAAAPVCSPTRGSAITGRHPFRYGIYSANTGHMKPEELTLAEILHEKGYRTGHFGKWHLGTLTKTLTDANRGGPKGVKHFSPPQENGFEVCFSTESKVPTWDPMWVPKDFTNGASRRLWWDPENRTEKMKHYGTRYWDQRGNEVTKNLRGANSKVIMDRAIPFIQSSVKSERPFFSVIWFHTPHLPVVAGPQYTALYEGASKYKQHYYGCITAMDEQIGRLREALKESGVAENTMLWFCSDNGPEGNESSPGKTGGFRGRKRSLYEGGVRVPGLLEWPSKVKPKTSTDFPASTVDYLPTILAALNIKMPDNRPTDGINLSSAIQGKTKVRQNDLGFQSGTMVSFVTHRYKLISKKRKKSNKISDSLELYDLLKDPYEKNNIALRNNDKVKELRTRLEDWIRSCSESDKGKDYNQKSLKTRSKGP